MYTKQPRVILANYTPHPERSVALAVSAWTSDNFEESIHDIENPESLAKRGLKAYHRTALEFVETVWIIKNVSRAFQQQLTRTRQAGYSIQSLRVVTKEGFAANGNYTMPPGLDDEQQAEYHQCMLFYESQYFRMLNKGLDPEDARGLLPLNIHSDISMHINLSALYHMLKLRLCVNTQWEYRQVAIQMKEQIAEHLGDMFEEPIDAPCMIERSCPMKDEFCGTRVWELNRPQRMRFYQGYVKSNV